MEVHTATPDLEREQDGAGGEGGGRRDREGEHM